MSATLAIVADAVDGALAGLDGSFGWGHAKTAAEPAGKADVTVTLRSGPGPGDGTWLHWAAGPPAEGAGADRLLAPAGDGLWRRAPWPVRDQLFDPREPDQPRVLVAEGDLAARDEALRAFTARDIEVDVAERLSQEGIEHAAAVVLLCGDDRALPAAAMSVPAAGRLLVTVGCDTAFGLLPGIDHLAAGGHADAAALVDVARAQWDAFAPMRAQGRVAAERHRASAVYERLLLDLELEGALG